MGANMRLLSGFGCFVCGSLAVLLCVAPANPDRPVNAALARMDAIAALAHSDAALAGPELRTALADPNIRAAVADPVIKVPLAEPEVNVSPLEVSDECVLSEECIDQYLWSVYERARKVDTIKVQEQIKTTVKKNGKSRTVTKTVTKLVDEDFTWKDPHAAEKAGMSVAHYVIGGMVRAFEVRVYYVFRALDDAGLAPGDPPHIAPIDGKEYADKRGLNAKLAEKGNAATSGVAKAAKPLQALQGRAEPKPL